MEDKLRTIVAKIERSRLSEQDKLRLYDTIARELQMTAVPILLKYLPKERVDVLANDTSKVTVESFADLIGGMMRDGKALEELNEALDELLKEIDAAVTEGGIV